MTIDGGRIPPGGVPLEPRRIEDVARHAVDVHGCVLIDVQADEGATYATPALLYMARAIANLDLNIAALRVLLEAAATQELERELEGMEGDGNDATNA